MLDLADPAHPRLVGGVETGGEWDVTASKRLWHIVNHNGGIGTGVTKDGLLYYHNSGGIAYCLDMKSGETLWERRLPGKGNTGLYRPAAQSMHLLLAKQTPSTQDKAA